MRRRRRAATTALVLLTGCYTGVAGGRGDDHGGTDATLPGDGSGTDAGGSESGDMAEPDDPGRVTLHRLNRAEYDNTIRDLFWGLDIAPAENFPADDHSFGFDNIADVLSVTPLLFDLYERATDGVLDAVFTAQLSGEITRAEAETGAGEGQAVGGAWLLTNTGAVTLPFEVTEAGDFTVRIRAWEQAAGPDAAELELLVDGVSHGTTPVTATEAAPEIYEFTVPLAAGARQIAASFTNDYYDEATSADRNLAVDWIEIELPGTGDPGATDIKANLLVCDPVAGQEAACTRTVLETFVPRAWRRPTTPEEIDTLVALAESVRLDGDDWEGSIRHALKAVLLSPHFIFRVEIDEPGAAEAHPVGEYELASRLSYFLWSSMPDEALFDAAAAGELHDPAVLEEQVARMIDDPRAEALMANFAGQWLYIRAVVPDIVKDVTLFPSYDAELNAAMRMEMELFFRTFVTERRSLRELLTADSTFLDARLATHYGLPAPAGAGFSEVSLAGSKRRGLMTMAGLMTVLSHPDTTSPVKRGKWVLEQLLCTPPAPPPPGVEADPAEPSPDASVREQLEEHRSNPSCAGCHNLIDPLGLGLEHYDPIGAFREIDGGKPVDASGNMPDGSTFTDALDMVALLSEREDFTRCTVKHAATYALGRGFDIEDPYLAEILADAEARGFSLEDLAIAIATNDVFRMRLPEEDSP